MLISRQVAAVGNVTIVNCVPGLEGEGHARCEQKGERGRRQRSQVGHTKGARYIRFGDSRWRSIMLLVEMRLVIPVGLSICLAQNLSRPLLEPSYKGPGARCCFLGTGSPPVLPLSTII